ncbi:MAG: transporter substrate-binding domain-containing protein [Halopseudomonas sp.]
MNRIGLICCVVVLLWSEAELSYAEKLKVAGTWWCPYICYPDEDKPGIMVEVIRAVLTKHDYQIDYYEIPWGRAINETQLGNYDALLGAARVDAPGLLFPEQELTSSQMCFFSRNSSKWQYEGIESLKHVDICVLKDDSFDSDIDAYINNQSNSDSVTFVYSSGYLERMFKMVEIGRCNAALSEKNVVGLYINDGSISDIFKNVGCANQLKSYLAISPKYKDRKKLLGIINKEITILRESGQMQVILNKYGLGNP